MKDDNILLDSELDASSIADIVAREPTLVAGQFEFEGKQYPVLLSQPFSPYRPATEISALESELVSVILCDFGSGKYLSPRHRSLDFADSG